MNLAMNHKACKICPALPKCNAIYRGKMCTVLRNSYGLGNPMTRGDRVRTMSDREMAKFFAEEISHGEYDQDTFYKWLKEPIEEVK